MSLLALCVIVQQSPSSIYFPRNRLHSSSTRHVVVGLGEYRTCYCEYTGKAFVVDTITIRYHRVVQIDACGARGCVAWNSQQQFTSGLADRCSLYSNCYFNLIQRI